MDVPLHAERTIRDGRQHVTLWVDGQDHLTPAPFLPYCYARQPFQDGPGGPVDQRLVQVRPLKTLETQGWYKAEFANVRDLARTAHQREAGEVAEANIPFTHRILLDRPDWYRSWPNGQPTRLAFDIEQLTTGERFPGEDDPLISIAWAYEDQDPECVLGDGQTDDDVIQAFLDTLDRLDPDVLVGYNAQGYDLPMLLARCRANRLDPTPLHREGGRIDELDRGQGVGLVGRLLYDAYRSVRADQTLYGIKDRRLKTVAKWRGIDVVEEDTTDTSRLVGTQRLATYNKSDVTVTREIARPYLANLIELASFYGAPLSMVAEATANFHCTTLQGRIMVDQGVVSEGTNRERYPELYAQTGGEGFVGGIVEIYQRGLFRPVTKVDFASMYPSILVALGAGAENTRYDGTVAAGPYEATRQGDRLELLIPDPSRATRHKVTIQGRSPLAEQLGELLERRLVLKQQAKAANTATDRSQATSKQGMIKVILNSVYGVMASQYARYASLPVAMAIVGTARQLIRQVEDHLGDAAIETDTDGVYAAGEVDADPIQEAVNGWISQRLGARPTLRVDADTYQAGWFHQGKNYLLLHHDGRLETHGVAFKGSSRAPMFDKALDRVARALLSGDEDVQRVAGEVLDLDGYDREDFVMRIRLGKDPGDYNATNHVAAQVARAAQKRGRDPVKGQQIPYVKVQGGYDVPHGDAFRRLDEAYYKEVLEKLLERLGVEAVPKDQRSLADFL